jgi:ribonuclease Z
MGKAELPVQRTLPLGQLTLAGYSRSTVATYLFVPELSILFDVGICPSTAAAATDVFLSHLHLDHALALPHYACHRNMLHLPPGRIHVPVGTRAAVAAWIDQLAALQGPERTHFDFELTEMAPGDERPLRGRHFVRALRTDHTVPSLGFAVFERREKLRPEFAGFPGEEIGRRKREGEHVTDLADVPLVTYLGDTGPRVFDDHPEVGESDVLVCECTFLAPEHRENARETKHIHIQDLAERAALLRSRKLVLTHFSMRYKEGQIREMARAALPGELFARVSLLL